MTIDDLIKSDTAKKNKIDNNPPLRYRKNLEWLIKSRIPELERVIGLGKGNKMVITSGYRCPELNKIVGGVAGSMHTVGLAIDFKIPDDDNPGSLLGTIGLLEVPFDELIYYASKNYYHIQFRQDSKNRSIRKHMQ